MLESLRTGILVRLLTEIAELILDHHQADTLKGGLEMLPDDDHFHFYESAAAVLKTLQSLGGK